MVECRTLNDEDDRPANILDHFTEVEEVLEMINTMKSSNAPGFENDFERYTEILSRYQEQPHLLDSHIEVLLQKLLAVIRSLNSDEWKVHAAFKYVYVICKVRTYKVLVKFLPHELCDLEFALELLEQQKSTEFANWETRYILLLWMSILVLNPFDISRLDAYSSGDASEGASIIHYNKNSKLKMQRIYELCQTYTSINDTCSSVAAYLTAKYLIRNDVKDVYLGKFFEWVINQNQQNTQYVKYGQLAAVAAILKHGKREDLLQYADKLLQWIVSCKYKDHADFLKYKLSVKIFQRLGMIYLKPQIANWRYKRGTRSLALNLTSISREENIQVRDEHSSKNNDEIIVPEAIEEIVEELLQGLRSSANDIRWSAAKGIGRVTNRLPKELGDEVIGSVIDILNPLERHEAWHGACLALAELAKRGLLLPYRLKELVPMLMTALFYDELKGYMSVGQHIRDAACYMCWAFARAYNPEDLQPFVNQISAGLLTVASFDREVNCRRAASAAFQESVGRLGNFPYGIEISTNTDFFSVGLRQNSYLNISDFIAQYEEYRIALIDHLVDRKVNHWDTIIRELSAKALHKLTFRAPHYVSTEIWKKLFVYTESIDVNTRHGSVYAIADITLALRKEEENTGETLITNQMLHDLNGLMRKFLERDLFKGMSGEMMKQCCIEFIKNCSLAKITAESSTLQHWQQIIDKCILNKEASLREAASSAFHALSESYYDRIERRTSNFEIVQSYLRGAENDLEEHIRMGYLSAIGALPFFMIEPHFEQILSSLIQHSLTPLDTVFVNNLPPAENLHTAKWSEARRDSIKALSNFVQTVGFNKLSAVSFNTQDNFDKIMNCFLSAMDEYTLDNRGDIGAWVREAAMNAIYQIITTCPKDLLKPNVVHKIMLNFMQQSVEKIDRTRGLAGRLCCKLVHAQPQIPHIQEHDKLKEVFPEDPSTVLWLFADHTFPLFCSLLGTMQYSKRILLGLSASIGQLTESLIKYSSDAFFCFLRSHPDQVPRLCLEITANFEENLLNERVTYPMISFLDILISSGAINDVLLHQDSNFGEDVYRLLDHEVKGYKKLYKLVSSINVFCQLIQIPRLCKKVFMKMSVFLGLTHVHVRKTTATKLYEALALYGDSCNLNEDNMEEALAILSETDWSLPLVEVRPIRNRLCLLLDIKPPISGINVQKIQT